MKDTKLYTSLLLSLLFIGHSMGQYTPEYYELKGKVRDVVTTIYLTNPIIIPHPSTKLRFDTEGRLIFQQNNDDSSTYHYIPNTALPDTICKNNHITTIIEYDSLRRKIGETEYIHGTAVKSTVIHFDTTTNTEYETHYTTNVGLTSQTMSIYDQDGCKIKECKYTISNPECGKQIVSSIEYIYDVESNPLQYIRYTYNVEGVNIRSIANYNKQGKIKEEKSYSSDDLLFRFTKNEYDKHGNIKKRTITFFSEYDNSKIVRTYDFKYKYDAQGNWTEQSYIIDDRIISTTLRQISYYNE